MSEFGLEQPIHKPTHITAERSSCMDLIFAPQSILVVESGVKSSMHQKLSSPNNVQVVFQRSNFFCASRIVFSESEC